MRKPSIAVGEFIDGFAKKYIEIDYDRVVRFRGEEKAATIKDLRNKLIIENYSLSFDYPSAVLFAGLDSYLRNKDEELLKTTIASITYRPGSTDATLRMWLEAVTGRVDSNDLQVMKHFIWQVKRKLTGHNVTYHMMPVIYGATGAGKSVAVDRLLSPLKAISTKRDFTVFEDDRKWGVFHRYYVITFDEMAKAARTDVNSMKSVISADKVAYRLLGTHEDAVGRNVSTFIGTSNDPISDIVLDPTSARRFWQITSKNPIDWETVNALDAAAMWQCVDEGAEEAPIASTWASVAATQFNEFRHKTPVEIWFEQHCELTSARDSSWRASALYEKFKSWSDVNKLGTLISSVRFSKDLVNIPGAMRNRDNRGTYYNITYRELAKDAGSGEADAGTVLDFIEKKRVD